MLWAAQVTTANLNRALSGCTLKRCKVAHNRWAVSEETYSPEFGEDRLQQIEALRIEVLSGTHHTRRVPARVIEAGNPCRCQCLGGAKLKNHRGCSYTRKNEPRQ